jgi:hypothetical protein
MIDAPALTSSVRPAIRELMRGLVDYAGLFPPASLDMMAAASEYAEHRGGPDAWALGRFVLPAARLEEFETAAGSSLPHHAAGSWALSALLGSNVEEDIERIEHFNTRHRDARAGAVIVDTVELKTHAPRDVAHAGELLDRRFDTYMEISSDAPADVLDAIASTTAKAKMRTGGVTPEAFPASAQVVRFAARCIDRDIAFKATAGLHHPWRAEYALTYAPDAPRSVMFGFLNVLLAVAILRAGLGEQKAIAALEERDPASVRIESDRILWKDQELSLALLGRARESLTAIGSCSFREPLGELRALQLL